MTARLPVEGLVEPAPAAKKPRSRAPAKRAMKRLLEAFVEPLPAAGDAAPEDTAADGGLRSRPGPARVGELLPVPLTEADVERIGEYQRAHAVRFGQAAVALALVSPADVAWALSQQAGYAWVREGESAAAPELVQARAPFGAAAEAFRDLRAHLASQGELAGKALAVVSTHAGDGRSFVAANLAVAFSQMGANTLIVDADLRRPRQHALFGLPSEGGLAGLLGGRLARSSVRRVPQLPGLHLLPAGVPPPNPLELLQRPALASLLADLAGAFDVVIVDTPPAQGLADARVVAAACGAALAVARKDHTPMAALHDLAATLTRLRAHFAGVVFNPA
ncbi:MAG: polysaccharide biosynthesis tyrosine autokinase [Rubrivivax sp.]|nr:polysaccharide biosynthesis tyrosine autokinase [Rubrivivax sp.]